MGGSTAGLLLVAGEEAGAAAGARARTPLEQTRSVYLQNTFEPLAFYRLPTVDPRTWVYVLEAKTMGGREARTAEDAQARPLVVCFFEEAPGAADELVVQRTDQATSGMSVQLLTVAELALHLGLPLPPDPARPAGDAEKCVEALLGNGLGIPRERYAWEHVEGAVDPHTYRLLAPRNADAVYFANWPLETHSKWAVAKHLERSHGWDALRLWNLTKPVLEAAVRDGDNPLGPPGADGADAAAAPAPGRGGAAAARGRGRGRARGGGRGRAAAAAPGRG